MKMTLHKEGYSILITLLISLSLLNTLCYLYTSSSIFYPILTLSLIFFLLVVNFFRNPLRINTDNVEDLLIAPSDGKIVVIEEVYEPEYFKEKRLQVSIFMSPLNVHAQWYPFNGEVLMSKHHNGRFMGAYLPKSSTENERSTIVLKNTKGTVILLRQVAGALARRIVTYAKEGMQIKLNDQFGFIKFGSRIDLYLPLDAEVLVKMDEKVRGNITQIARFKQS